MIYVINDDQKFPFSKGILARSIASTGLPVSEAYQIVWEVRNELQAKGIEEIQSHKLKQLVLDRLLEKDHQVEARYYKLRSEVTRVGQPIFCLFGGGTGVGKTTIASEVGYRIGINRVIGTDTIREILRGFLPHRLIPTLHTSSFKAVDELRTSSVENGLIHAFEQQVNPVNEGLISVLKRGDKEGLSMVLEGVHIVPGLVRERMEQPPENLFEYVIDVPDPEKHKRLFYAREEGSKRGAERYINDFDRIRQIHEYILDRAKQNNAKIVRNLSFTHAVEEIMADLLSKLEKLSKEESEAD